MPAASNSNQIDIIAPADSMMQITQNGITVRKLIGHVALRQGTTLLYCDMAIRNEIANTVEAFGHVKIIQGDTVTITGDTAFYFGSYRKANIRGRVLLDDRNVKLTTRQLDYDLGQRLAIYNTPGRITDRDGQILTSQRGVYNTVSKIFVFKEKVKIINPKEKFNLTADSLRYSTATKEAFFIAPARIINDADTNLVKNGSYNTRTRVSNFIGRSTVRTKDYEITGDTLFSDAPTEIRIARGNVIFYSKKDQTLLTGMAGKQFGKTGVAKVYGQALMRNWRGKDSLTVTRDTLFLAADTLVSIDDKGQNIRKLLAFKKVQIFKESLQGRADSLCYNLADSVINFYQKPILWNKGSQSEADSIFIALKENKPHLMTLKGRSFVIQQDTVQNFNQIKGRKVIVNFDQDGGLRQATTEGNGESVYYVLNEKNAVTGMNRVQCSRMSIQFSNNKVKKITFMGKPEGRFIPPKEIREGTRFLDNFEWRTTLRPTKVSTTAGRLPGAKVPLPDTTAAPQPTPTPKPQIRATNRMLRRK
jgi:lipopolysaccharide export system protein LptA